MIPAQITIIVKNGKEENQQERYAEAATEASDGQWQRRQRTQNKFQYGQTLANWLWLAWDVWISTTDGIKAASE